MYFEALTLNVRPTNTFLCKTYMRVVTMKTLMFYFLVMSCFNSFGNICVGKETSISLNNVAKTEFLCDDTGSILVLKGKHIKFSEFIKDDEKLGSHCKNPIKSLSIFATDEVIIDRNLRGPGMKVYVFAPLWTIVGSRKINLNGLEPPQKEKVFRWPSPAGASGASGFGGNLGGDFVGFGYVFINGANLTISVSGGDGEDGDNGTRGLNGDDGEFPDENYPHLAFLKFDLTMLYQDSVFELLCGRLRIDSSIQAYSNKRNFKHFNVSLILNEPLGFNSFLSYCTFEIPLIRRFQPGNGGDAGQGGAPGNPGNVRLFELHGSSGIHIKKEKGKRGKDGIPGIPGVRSDHGDIFNYNGRCSVFEGLSLVYTSFTPDYRFNTAHGKVAKDVKSSAVAHKELVPSDIASILVEYKGYFLNNHNLTDSSDFKVEFYISLGKHEALMSIFDTHAIVKELSILETSFHKLHATFDFLPLYQSLSNRIVAYAKQRNSLSRSSAEHKKVLTYLYTTILSREYNLKDRSESNLIVETGEYLKLVQESIAKYKASNKIKMLETLKTNYEINIAHKTEEAHELISSEIIPELEIILKENVKNVNLTLDKIIELEDKTQKDMEEMKKNKDELEKKMATSLCCDLLSLVGTVVSVLPGIAGLAGETISATAGLIDDGLGVQEGDLHIPPPNNVLEGAKAVDQTVNDFRNQAKTDLSERIEFSIASLTEHPDEFSDLLSEIYQIQNKLSTVTDTQGISQLSKELRQVIQKSQDQTLEESNYRSKKQKTKRPPTKRPNTRAAALTKPKIEHRKPTNLNLPKVVKSPKNVSVAALKIVSAAVEIGKESFGIFKKNSQNKEHLRKLAEAIERKKEYLDQLRKHEDAVRNEMGPALELMAANLLGTANSLGSKSQVSLDVIKWKMQSKLKNMQLGIISMVKGLNVSDSFENTFRKIDAAINTLIGVYDRIQGFKDQQNLGKYIADINSAGSHLIHVTDLKLKKDLDYLNVILDCNTVIQQYQIAVDAFRQYVFPFADLFFPGLVLPQYLSYGEDLNGLVIKAETQIAQMKAKYDEYRFIAKPLHSYIGEGEFNSNYSSVRPFFVWDNKNYHTMISKLLSGEKVIVFADVKKSMRRYDAVKFNEVEINFKAKDKKTQLALNDVLNDYEITAIHMGNSYFRTDDQFFLITTGPLKFWYNYEKNHNGQPVTKNLLLNMIKDGAYMLSPYATWELQLTHTSEKNPQAFHVLNKYKKLVDVELIGHGRYVNKDQLDIVDLKINQYYTPLYRNYTP